MREEVAKAVARDLLTELENAGIVRACSMLDKRLGNLAHVADQLTSLCADHRVMAQALRDQDAEIARLSDALEREQGVREDAQRQLRQANALLREAVEWNWLDDCETRPDVMDVLEQRITAHLQEQAR